MKLTLSSFNRFLARSCWIVPLYFYVWISLFLRKSSLPVALIFLSAGFTFIWVWAAKWVWYREKNCSNVRFAVDLSLAILGLALIYSADLGVFGNIDTHSAIYLFSYTTNVPAVMSVKRILSKQ